LSRDSRPPLVERIKIPESVFVFQTTPDKQVRQDSVLPGQAGMTAVFPADFLFIVNRLRYRGPFRLEVTFYVSLPFYVLRYGFRNRQTVNSRITRCFFRRFRTSPEGKPEWQQIKYFPSRLYFFHNSKLFNPPPPEADRSISPPKRRFCSSRSLFIYTVIFSNRASCPLPGGAGGGSMLR
jgi:hypothetical protein